MTGNSIWKVCLNVKRYLHSLDKHWVATHIMWKYDNDFIRFYNWVIISPLYKIRRIKLIEVVNYSTLKLSELEQNVSFHLRTNWSRSNFWRLKFNSIKLSGRVDSFRDTRIELRGSLFNFVPNSFIRGDLIAIQLRWGFDSTGYRN